MFHKPINCFRKLPHHGGNQKSLPRGRGPEVLTDAPTKTKTKGLFLKQQGAPRHTTSFFPTGPTQPLPPGSHGPLQFSTRTITRCGGQSQHNTTRVPKTFKGRSPQQHRIRGQPPTSLPPNSRAQRGAHLSQRATSSATSFAHA